MTWKKKTRVYKGKNFHYSFRNKLKKEKKLPDNFEAILNTLTIEELIALKLELSSSYINNKLYNFPIWNNIIYMVKDACLKYALSACRTKREAARFLGMDERNFETEIKRFKTESFFDEE